MGARWPGAGFPRPPVPSAGHCLEFGLHPAGYVPTPCLGVVEEVEDDGTGILAPVTVIDAVHGSHGIQVGDGSEVWVGPVSPDLGGDDVEGTGDRSGYRLGCFGVHVSNTIRPLSQSQRGAGGEGKGLEPLLRLPVNAKRPTPEGGPLRRVDQ